MADKQTPKVRHKQTALRAVVCKARTEAVDGGRRQVEGHRMKGIRSASPGDRRTKVRSIAQGDCADLLPNELFPRKWSGRRGGKGDGGDGGGGVPRRRLNCNEGVRVLECGTRNLGLHRGKEGGKLRGDVGRGAGAGMRWQNGGW